MNPNPQMRMSSILGQQLPVNCHGPGAVGRARTGRLSLDLQRHARAIRNGTVSDVLKRTERRLVFRDGDHVVKVVFLGTLHRKLRWRRYGRSEAGNLIRADALGVTVPRVLALGRLRTWRDPLVASVLVTENLQEHLSLADQLLGAADRPQRQRRLDATVPLLVDLLRTGCFHVDISPDNVFLPRSAEDGQRPAVIDFEYAEFVMPGSTSQLARQAGRLAHVCGLRWPELDYDGWFENVVHAATAVTSFDPAARRAARGMFATCRERSVVRREPVANHRAVA